MSWIPIGSPSRVVASGSEIAAKPETLAMHVQPVVANSTRKNSWVEPRGWLRWASGGGPPVSRVGTRKTSWSFRPSANRRVWACTAAIAPA